MPSDSGTPPFPGTHISHAIAVLVLGLAFYSKDPDDMGDATNVFLLPGLPLLASFEAVLLARIWDAILGGGAFTSFADTNLIIAKH